MKKYRVINAGGYGFRLGLGSTVNEPTCTHYIDVPKGDIVEHESTTPNGDVWFWYNGKRGRVQSGTLEPLIKNRTIEPVKSKGES